MTFIVRFLAGVGVGGLISQYLLAHRYREEAQEVERKLMSLREEVIKKTQEKLLARTKT